ncbi:MAG: hypothetical protein M3Z14_06090 [Candidatus Eremiobacteraeota bacterium]|nr:hypothetical protein [Candidatus Eremiobacteraeota bacterium]
MAHPQFDYKLLTGSPDDELAMKLSDLSATKGWEVVSMAGHDRGKVAVLLKRDKDYEVAQSLQQALEEAVVPLAAIESEKQIEPL